VIRVSSCFVSNVRLCSTSASLYVHVWTFASLQPVSVPVRLPPGSVCAPDLTCIEDVKHTKPGY
jgi:hypothetical protein